MKKTAEQKPQNKVTNTASVHASKFACCKATIYKLCANKLWATSPKIVTFESMTLRANKLASFKPTSIIAAFQFFNLENCNSV